MTILHSMTPMAATIKDEDGNVTDFALVRLGDLDEFKTEYLEPNQTIQAVLASIAIH